MYACDSFTSPTGKIWKVNGIYYDTITQLNGCDTIMTYNLIMNALMRDSLILSGCDTTVYWRGNTYQNTVVISDTVTSGGCDSVFTLDLTIYSSVTVTRKDTACERIQLPGGLFVTNSGTYRDTFGRSNGCDSIIVSEVIVNQPSSSIHTLTVCNTMTSPTGKVWISDGTYYDTLINSSGCDSLLTFNLTFSQIYRDTINHTQCNGNYIWRGTTYVVSSVISETVTTGVCDSIFTLDLTINSSVTVTRKDTACERIQLPNGLFVTSSGTYRDTFARSNGCDSIIVSEIIVNQPSSSIQTLSVCNAMNSPSGKVWNTTGTFFDTIVNSSGCDSLMRFNLTVNSVNRLVSIQGVTITANQGAAAYQWLDCSNGYLKITGETNQSYSPTVNGTYAVEITQNECVDTSVCSIIKSVAIDENDKQDLFEIFPNPTSQIVHVLSLEKSTGTKIYIYNSIGKIVLEVKFPPYKNKTTIDVSTLENGMYIIALESKKGVVGKRIVISK